MATDIWVNIGSGNGLMIDGTKPLPEPTLIYHQWGPVSITWELFHKWYRSHQSQRLAWKLLIQNCIQISQGPMSYRLILAGWGGGGGGGGWGVGRGGAFLPPITLGLGMQCATITLYSSLCRFSMYPEGRQRNLSSATPVNTLNATIFGRPCHLI